MFNCNSRSTGHQFEVEGSHFFTSKFKGQAVTSKVLYLLKAKFPQYMRLRTPIAFTKHSCRVQSISAMFASGCLHILTPHKTDFELSSVQLFVSMNLHSISLSGKTYRMDALRIIFI